MVKGNVKLLIYDLLDLIDNNHHENCETIEQMMGKGKLVSYLLEKYNMTCFSKTDTQEVSDLLKEKVGCAEKEYNNGLIYLIDLLLDCE